MTLETFLPDLLKALLALAVLTLGAIIKKQVDEYWPQRRVLIDRVASRASRFIIPLSVLVFVLYAALLIVIPRAPTKIDFLVGLVTAIMIPISVAIRGFSLLIGLARGIISLPSGVRPKP